LLTARPHCIFSKSTIKRGDRDRKHNRWLLLESKHVRHPLLQLDVVQNLLSDGNVEGVLDVD
jgi:hypothetical protein